MVKHLDQYFEVSNYSVQKRRQGGLGRLYKAYIPTAQTSSSTNFLLLMLYLNDVSLQYDNKMKFSSWVSVLGLCTGHMIETYLRQNLLFAIVNMLQVVVFLKNTLL